MTLNEAYEKRRQECLALQRENSKLKEALEEVNKGTYTSPEKAGNLKNINKLHQENLHLKKEVDKYKSLWQEQIQITENFRSDATLSKLELEDVIKERDEYQTKCLELQTRLDAILGKSSSENEYLKAQVAALKEALLAEKAKADTDGTNSGLPTSKTPIGKKKVIPNSRSKSGKKRGGQKGHEKHSLAPLDKSDINDYEDHTLESCPKCGSDDLVFIDERYKDEIDYEVRIIKKRHRFFIYRCRDCGKIVRSTIPMHLKEPIQYGSAIKAMLLALLDLGYISINRAQKIINGFLENNISISEGYICNQQKRASAGLKKFIEEVKIEAIKSHVLHWDDTVIFVNTKRACMRFYGNEHISLFKAHETKARSGIDEDGILPALGPDAVVVHDHVTMNYNDDFFFDNAECVQHLSRELKGISDVAHHTWSEELRELISKYIHERNTLISSGAEGFPESKFINVIYEVEQIIKKGWEEHKESKGHYYENDEKKLLKRLDKYKENYFKWIEDIEIPPTNNLAERGLRGQKTKLKISGQYQNIKSAEYFADIRTYIETCSKNGIDIFTALSRLTSGNPFTLKELLHPA